eukprot:2303227-Rhodomonas_salina.2
MQSVWSERSSLATCVLDIRGIGMQRDACTRAAPSQLQECGLGMVSPGSQCCWSARGAVLSAIGCEAHPKDCAQKHQVPASLHSDSRKGEIANSPAPRCLRKVSLRSRPNESSCRLYLSKHAEATSRHWHKVSAYRGGVCRGQEASDRRPGTLNIRTPLPSAEASCLYPPQSVARL